MGTIADIQHRITGQEINIMGRGIAGITMPIADTSDMIAETGDRTAITDAIERILVARCQHKFRSGSLIGPVIATALAADGAAIIARVPSTSTGMNRFRQAASERKGSYENIVHCHVG